ncbi:choice-of-anchor D domain-containing protein [Acidicapsa ligni]|uniref:choice-of-anchor D domain-containing protein n=1 Tax=Acidicapsa ligni TaxID=542300 RepID=UPI0021DFF95A|nr:choice-of-anchor D domain-containing protein [Acidicapsa ligni]
MFGLWAGVWLGVVCAWGQVTVGAKAGLQPVAGPVSGPVPKQASEPARVRAARRFLERRGWRGARQGQVRRAGHAAGSVKAGPEAAATGQVWAAGGPVGVNSAAFGLVTGRVSSVAFDPSDATGNHVFVGTTGGGLWESVNAAASNSASVVFLPLTDRLAALTGVQQAGISVGAVTVQPGATGVMLAGLGDPNDALDSYYGAGLLRSTDGGATWSLIQQTVDFEQGFSTQDYSFVGEGFAGFAWSTTNVQLVVAAVSQAYEGTLVNAGIVSASAGGGAASYEGLYYSNDGGASWHLARITDGGGQDVQGPEDVFTLPDGNAATAVVWNPERQVFVAAVRFHGYYQSSDGVTWTRMTAQPGSGLTAGNCPTEAGEPGVAGCPMFRGSLAVNPFTGDTFAWSVDEFSQDQGIWQDQCGLSGGVCSNQTISFGAQLNTAALEADPANGDLTIANGDYNLALAAVPSLQDTLLFAGGNDLWKCSLAAGCVWRNTTNSTTCMSADVAEYEHAVAWNTGNSLLMFLGTDGGLWRSWDDVGETGSVCAGTDAGHVQNLNASLGVSGSLTEVESLAQSGATAGTMLIGMGANGFAGVVNAPAVAGDWSSVLGGEGGSVAIDQTSHVNSWFANAGAGVAIYHCDSSTACTPGAFGVSTGPVIGEAQVANDGLTMAYPASFRMDAADATQLLVGTCRVWRGPATGAGWTGANAISPVLDGTGGGGNGAGGSCEGNGLIRSIAAMGTAGGGEVIYVGMAGQEDGGGVVAGHVFMATVSATGVVSGWTDLSLAGVTNTQLAFNAFGMDVSSLYADPHDATGGTVYATIAGFSSVQEPTQQVYGMVGAVGAEAQWTALTGNLSNAPANAVVVDPQDANTVYVAMDIGVFVTRDVGSCGTGAACWAPYGTGLPQSPVTQLIATPTTATSAVLTAGTYGRGVWQIPLASAGVAVATATVSPASLTFGSYTVGVSSTAQSVTVKNTGSAALAVTSVAFTGDAADFSETDTCVGQALMKNATCVVKVSFAPTDAGSRSGELVIEANVTGGQMQVAVNGTGLAAGNVTLLPTSLSFGTVQVATSATTQVINVQNVGGSSATISSVTVTAPFVKSASTCGSSLAANSACAVTVGFTPTQAGPVTGTFSVKDSLGTQSAALTGTGITGATDTLSTTSLSFPSTVMGQVSAPLSIQITNSGGLPLTGIGTSLTGAQAAEYSAVSNCGSTLAAGASCAVSVTFAPTASGAAGASLLISDALKSQTVKLTGTGLRPAVITVNPVTMNFGSVQMFVASAAKTLTIGNSGGSPLANPGFTFTGPGSASFSVGTTSCGTSLTNGSSCTVQVIFTPLAAGATTATLTVGSSSPGVATGTVALMGTGLTPPTLGVSPASLNLGALVVGNSTNAYTVQVTNTGQTAMNQPTFAITGANVADFALQVPTDIPACTGALAPAAMCSIQVIFSPTLVGVETAELTVTAVGALQSPTTVSLMGTGTPLILLQANPMSLSFPKTPEGTASAPLTVSISNLGRQMANGLALALAGPYQFVPSLTTCGTKLTAVTSCTVGVSFDPTASGDAPGTLMATVTNIAVASLTVPLDGTGVAVGLIQLMPTQMTFGSEVLGDTSAAQTATVTNVGEADLAGVKVSVTGTVTGEFGLSGNMCGDTLAAGASCTTGVTFTPSTSGNQAGVLTVNTTSAGVMPGTVGIMGTGIPAGELEINPAVVSFGEIVEGQTSSAQMVTVTNVGLIALEGLQYVIAGNYNLTQNSCGVELLSGASCSMEVSFAPLQDGTLIGSVTISSTNAGFVPVVVGLTGTGLSSAKLAAAPTQLLFGSVAVGMSSAALQLTVTNGGAEALTGLHFGVAGGFTGAGTGAGSGAGTGAGTEPFALGPGNCGESLDAGASCSVPVTFVPTAGGDASGMVTISTTSLGVAAATVPVTGTGVVPPAVAVSPQTVNFVATTVGLTTLSQTVTISNTGGQELTGLTLGISGTAAADFHMGTATCTGTLEVGAACSVRVYFSPTGAGGRQASLTVSSTTASAVATLAGTGLTPAVLTVTPVQLTFATTLLGQVSATQTVTVTNSGQTTVPDLSLYATPGFEVDAARTTCTTTLLAGANCAVGVAFAPVAGGAITGALTVSSAVSAESGTAPATVALNGTAALPPGIQTMPEALVLFGATGAGATGIGATGIGQAAQPIQVTLTNTGTVTGLTGLKLAVDAAGMQAGFGLSGSTCGVTLAAGGSCTVNVTFTPTAVGQLTGNLAISSTNGTNTAMLTLGGTGFDFQMGVVGSASASVVQGQTANYTLSVTPLGAPGSFTFQCGTLPANATCSLNPMTLQGLPENVNGNVSVGISTGAPTSSNASRNVSRESAWPAAGVLLCGLLAMPWAWRKRRSLLLGVVLLAAAAGAVGMMSSCTSSGGQGGPGGGKKIPTGGTPSGTYPVTITASASGVTHTFMVTLVVN